MADKMINWDMSMLQRLKRVYELEVMKGSKSFVFEGNEFDVGYAKYLIEYLEMQLGPADGGVNN